MIKRGKIWLRSVLIIGLSAVMAATISVHGALNEGITLALEAAFPYVKDGYKVREDNWSGEIKNKKPLLVKHQLFRGNEYWFWAATAYSDTQITVGVFDSDGNSVSLESFSKDGRSGVRVLPNQTGSYYIRVAVTTEESEGVDWGLVYGYR